MAQKIEKDVLLEKFRKPVLNSAYIEEWSILLKALPYSLTPSQLSAVSELIWDLKRHVLMQVVFSADISFLLSYFFTGFWPILPEIEELPHLVNK